MPKVKEDSIEKKTYWRMATRELGGEEGRSMELPCQVRSLVVWTSSIGVHHLPLPPLPQWLKEL